MICKLNGNPKNKSIIGTEKIMIKDSKCTITKSIKLQRKTVRCKHGKMDLQNSQKKKFLVANKSLSLKN